MKNPVFISPVLSSMLVWLSIMVSCNGNSPVPPAPVMTDISMYVADQKELPAEYAPWSTTNPFVAEVQSGTLLIANHVGQITLNSKDSACTLAVLPRYTYAPYPDPILTWGISKNDLKKLLGNPQESTQDHYTYFSSDRKVSYDYSFAYEPEVLCRVRVTFDKESEYISAEKVASILEERYCLVATKTGSPTVSTYVDCTKQEYEQNKKNATTKVELMIGWLQMVEYSRIP